MAWRCVVSVAGITVSHVQVDDPFAPADPDLPLPQLLSVRWVDELGEQWPGPRAVSTGTVAILFADAMAAGVIRTNDPISVDLYRPDDAVEPVATFYGRVGDPQLTPSDYGVTVTLPMADYRADLANATAGEVDYPQEAAADRMDRIMLGYEASTGVSWGGYPTTNATTIAARDASPTSLLALVNEVAAYAVGEGFPGFAYMYEPVPVIDAGQLVGWVADRFYVLSGGVDAPVAPLVGTFFDDGTGVWRVTSEDSGTTLSPAGGVKVDASDVLFGATWTRTRAGDVNTVDVQLDDETIVVNSTAYGDTPIVASRLETPLTQVAAANRLAAAVLGTETSTPAARWAADRFTILVDDTPEDVFPFGDPWWPGDLRDSLAVIGIPTQHNPEGTDWWSGAIRAREVMIEGGECRVDVELAAVRLAKNASSPSWNAVPESVQWIDVHPTVTWNSLASAYVPDAP